MSEGRVEVWSKAAVLLLKGPVYKDEVTQEVWNNTVKYIGNLRNHFAVLGLSVVLSEEDGYAYLLQKSDQRQEGMSDEGEMDENSSSYAVPRLARRVPLSFDASVLLVILRDQLEKFDASTSEDAALILKKEEIRDYMVSYIREKGDEVKLDERVNKAILAISRMTYLKPLSGSLPDARYIAPDAAFEVRPILRDRLNVDTLRELLSRLSGALGEHDDDNREEENG